MIDYISLEKYAKEISILFVEDDKGISKKMEILLYEIFSTIYFDWIIPKFYWSACQTFGH